MKVPHFVLGLTLLTSASVLFHFMTEPFLATGQFTQYNLLWLLGSAFGSVAGGLLGGLLVWPLLKNTACGKIVRDRLTCGLYGAAMTVGALIVIGIVFSPMSAAERQVFVSGVERTCFPTQRSSPVNDNFTDEQLRKYCSCVALFLSRKITKKEVRYFWKNESMPLSAQQKAFESGTECKRELSN